MRELIAHAWQASPLRRRLDALAPRERLLVAVCLAAVALALLYAAASPLIDFRQDAVARYSTEQADLSWMQANRNAAEARLHESSAAPQARLSTINAVAKELNLPLRRMQPEADGFSIQLEAQPFDRVILWTRALETRHGIEIVSASIDVHDLGVVNARFGVR